MSTFLYRAVHGRPRRAIWRAGLAVAVIVLGGLAALPSVGPSSGGIASALPGPPGAVPPATPSLSTLPPGGVLGNLSVSIYNPGANATGTYDQPVAINSSRFADLINANWTNGLAEYSANDTPIYGWIESGASNASVDTLLWLRLGSIPPHGWSNVTVWFWPKNSFNLSESGYMGEAPQLSAGYGEFDNGWRVFDGYWNFSGTSLPAGWTPLGNWAGKVDNGVTVEASYQSGAIEWPFAAPYASNLTVETAAQLNASGDPVSLFLAATPGFSSLNQFYPSAYALEPGFGGPARAALVTSNASGAETLRVPVADAPLDFRQASIVVGLSWEAANSTEVGSANYVPFVSQVNASNRPIGAVGLGADCAANCTSWNVSWVRTRPTPNPMPTIAGEAFNPVAVAVAASAIATDVNHPVILSCNASALPAPALYTWDLGDGGSARGSTVVHSFSHPGDYRPTCTAASPSGVAGSSSLNLLVNPSLAILLFQAVPSTLSLGGSLSLIVNVSGGTAPFTIGYSGLPPGCLSHRAPTLSCLPAETGTFAVEVTVSDAAGEQASNSITITIDPPSKGNGPTALSPAEGYALAGAVSGLVVLAGVLPVLLWTRPRNGARAPPPTRQSPGDGPESEFEPDTSPPKDPG